MADTDKLQNYLWGVTFAAQLLLHFVCNEYVAVIAPPLLATIPNVYLLKRSKKIAKMGIARGWTAILLGCAVWGMAAILLLAPIEQDWKFLMARAVFVYGAILYPVRMITIIRMKSRVAAA